MFDDEDAPEWARKLLNEVRSLKDTCTTRFDGLETSIAQMKKDLRATTNRIKNAETRISSIEDKNNLQEKAVAQLSKDFATLQGKVLDLEARNRRNDLILIGLPEGAEGAEPSGLTLLFGRIFRNFLKRNATDPVPDLERIHRSPSSVPDPGCPPRHIIMRFLRWSKRNEVMQAMKQVKGKLSWDGTDLSLFQDLPREMQLQRETYKELRDERKARPHTPCEAHCDYQWGHHCLQEPEES
ncbi:hypothetical protein ABVT39_020394 [Epinephelus coioides]